MARTDWAALLTEPAAEYIAHSELLRFGLDAYLPQLKKRHHIRSGGSIMRSFPLFPRYLLVPYPLAHDPAIRLARGIARHRCLLADDDGRPWRAPQKIIDAIRTAEYRGDFDGILHKGDSVTLTYGVLATVRAVCSSTDNGMVELLLPLLGGARATVEVARLIHAV